MPTSNPAPSVRKRHRALRPSMFACVMLAFGLLLWARFILVTGHPRTAIAEPAVVKAQQPKPQDAPRR
ncbi:MAG: hypothetical protein K2W85_02265 [Phycisphaerales bacterium]|nr:hypothetical protein [Phycisphaerales bacterium]